MHTDLNKKAKKSFLSSSKDLELILRKVFVESPYKKELRRLLVIPTADCLEGTGEEYTEVENMSLSDLVDGDYIRIKPKIAIDEHAEVQSYIVISFDNFMPTDNPQFRDCSITFDVLCYTDYWDLGDYRIRPLQICGCIDAIMDRARLSGIGQLQFVGCQMLIMNEKLSGYSLTYYATHGGEDAEATYEEE